MIYALETYEVTWGQTPRFVEAFNRHHLPTMASHGARLVGAWEPVALTRQWPGAVVLWEYDDPATFQDAALDLHLGDPSPMQAWQVATEGIVTRGEGRILHPAQTAPTRQALFDAGTDLSVVVFEIIQTQPDRQVAYGEHIEDVWLPSAEQLGRIWVGTYHTVWKNQEAVSIWALQNPRRPFPGGDMMEQDVFDTAGVRQWNRTALSVRVGYDDGVLVALAGVDRG